MPRVGDTYKSPSDLVLGTRLNGRVPETDQQRQRDEVVEILRRLRRQPGVILADEVGMGKTFVALAVAFSVAVQSPKGPVIVMVPANLVDKWEQDLKTFCELYLDGRKPVHRQGEDVRTKDLVAPSAVRYGVARDGVELMKLLDDPARERCHLIFLAHGAMGRRQNDKWVRLALIAEALRRHGRGKADKLIQVKASIHRYLAELLWAIGEERASDWGDELWKKLLKTSPETWKDVYNSAISGGRRLLEDDPVPKAVLRTIPKVHLSELAEALKGMPIRARGGDERVSERVAEVRKALRTVENELWKDLLAQARWRSPLLVMDEAHHLKNPGTALARQLQSADSESDLKTGDGAMANAFDRMLFLTATPFQLGHRELVRVLERFRDVRWDVAALGEPARFDESLQGLAVRLDNSQRAAIHLQRCWGKLQPSDGGEDVEEWWGKIRTADPASLELRQRAVVDAYQKAKERRDEAEAALAPWLVRHNKGLHWSQTETLRRQRLDGDAVQGGGGGAGLPIPPDQLLPFFLAARSAVNPSQDLLGEALSSSFEAFRLTRKNKGVKDDQEGPETIPPDMVHQRWYLKELDEALERTRLVDHPKIRATVQRAVDLWQRGEKVLVFAFYRHTCRALRVHISEEIERRILLTAEKRLRDAGQELEKGEIERLIERVQARFFDSEKAPGRQALDHTLGGILESRAALLDEKEVHGDQREQLIAVMRRFLRVSTTLVRCFPIAEFEDLEPAEAVSRMLGHVDESGVSWRQKFDEFLAFLLNQCATDERASYLEAAHRTQTGGIRVEGPDDEDGDGATVTLANVQVATGETRRDKRSRLMRAFNTPFFPDILVSSQVMGEGVDLQRFCRHVIHHDLDWNPSTIEQRTGRIDRLGCKAEGRHSIMVYLPYLSGASDERQYRVMSERERWFRVVMGQDEVAKLITADTVGAMPLPRAVADELQFNLGLEHCREVMV